MTSTPLRRVVRLAPVIAVAIMAAACAPLTYVQPTVERPTEVLYVPGIEAPGPAQSPLLPATPPPAAAQASPAPVAQATEASGAQSTETPVAPATEAPVSGEPASAAAGPSLLGPTWEWVSSIFSDGLALVTGDPARYTVQFAPDGSALLQADCNFGSGLYQVDGDSLKFDAIGTTKMACRPDSLDSEFLGQLYNVDRFELEGAGLVLYLREDAGSMRFRAAGAEVTATSAPALVETPATAAPATPVVATTPAPAIESLNATKWRVTSLLIGEALSELQAGSEITLDINANGTGIEGSTGCNPYRAVLALDGASFGVQGVARLSRQICPSAVSLQEIEFLEALLQTRTSTLQDNELTLLDADDVPLMVLSQP